MWLLVADILPRADNSCRVLCNNITYAPHQHQPNDQILCSLSVLLLSLTKSKEGVKVKEKKKDFRYIWNTYLYLVSMVLKYCSHNTMTEFEWLRICSVALSIISQRNRHCAGIHFPSENWMKTVPKLYLLQLRNK